MSHSCLKLWPAVEHLNIWWRIYNEAVQCDNVYVTWQSDMTCSRDILRFVSCPHDISIPIIFFYLLYILQISPCLGWMNTNATIRNLTTQVRASVSTELALNFDLLFKTLTFAITFGQDDAGLFYVYFYCDNTF